MSNQRKKWIDVYKGMAIMTVPLAHIIPTFKYFYLFHMPLFFFLAGYTFHKDDTMSFLRKKANRLLRPHLSYFLLLVLLGAFVPSLIGGSQISTSTLKNFIWDTTSLTYEFGTFWFIPVLFLSLISALLLICKYKIGGGKILIICYLAALVFDLVHVRLWQGLQNVPLALFYVIMGYIWANNKWGQSFFKEVNKYCVLILCVFLTLSVFMPSCMYLDMKHAQLGIPVISVALSLLYIFAFMVLSKTFSERKNLYRFFYTIGAASIPIMYLHQFIHFHLAGILPSILIVLISIAFPVALYWVYNLSLIHI